MENGPFGPQPASVGAELMVGGRKFTREEFLDALTRAVLETVQSYSSGNAGNPGYAWNKAGDSAENLEPGDEGRCENAIEVTTKAFE
jgi:hypothetical protein